jgi:hypothetical protein
MEKKLTSRFRTNERGGVDAGRALCLHLLRSWPGAAHRERSALLT